MSARVAVIGATGTIGAAVSGALLERGTAVLAISRGESAENAASRARLREGGAELRDVADLTDVDVLARLLRGSDALVVAMRASPRIIPATEPAILRAALRAVIAPMSWSVWIGKRSVRSPHAYTVAGGRRFGRKYSAMPPG